LFSLVESGGEVIFILPKVRRIDWRLAEAREIPWILGIYRLKRCSEGRVVMKDSVTSPLCHFLSANIVPVAVLKRC